MNFVELTPILKELAAKSLKYKEYEAEELARRLGLVTRLRGDEEAELMGLKDVYKGVFIPKAGIIDADCVVKFYEEEFMRLGGEIRYGVKVEDLIVEACQPLGIAGEPFFWQESRVSGVKTNSGIIKAKKTILAAGAWIPQLLDSVGIECFIKPKKRQVFAVEAKNPLLKQLLFTQGFNSVGCIPFTILPKPRVLIRPFPTEGVFGLVTLMIFQEPLNLRKTCSLRKTSTSMGYIRFWLSIFPSLGITVHILRLLGFMRLILWMGIR